MISLAELLPRIDKSPELCPTDTVMNMAEKQQQQGRKRQRNKTVSFSDVVRQTQTYSIDEVQDCWYSGQEYQAMREEVRTSVELMATHHVVADEIHVSQRGLEMYDKYAARTTREAQVRAFWAVLQRQAAGYGQEDPSFLASAIAESYALETRSRKMAAYLVGIADERFALRFLQQEE